MKKIELVPGIQSSVLGFGCASIMGARSANESKKAISMAVDYGITHFDLARSYGYGEAERFVGNILAKEREKFVISSKFGIKANGKAKLLSPLKPLIRVYKKIKKPKEVPSSLNSTNSVHADRFHDRVLIRKVNMITSLEASLKALNTDYLDYFFIHEPLETIESIEEILETSELLKKKGQIKALGLAFTQEQQILHSDYLHEFDILQFNNSPGIINYNTLIEQRGTESNIFFSPINGGSTKLQPNEKLKTLHQDFPKSVILCSTFNEKHMKQNVSLFSN